MRIHLAIIVACLFLLMSTACPDDQVKRPSEGQKALARFRVIPGVQGALWAEEPLLANPVAFAFDEEGRCFVAETYRLHKGVTDNRGHMKWLDDDLASRTVADRVAMYRKHLGKAFSTYESAEDRVTLVWDSKGKGVADASRVFADGFRAAAEGLGAGVFARKGQVYFTNIPDLWLLKDPLTTGEAGQRRSLATGFGVHVAFIGHDMHGLCMGPDGLLYFSIGDRGLNVNAGGKNLYYPDCGAILRCEPDGSRLEVVASGLRNPQELAFDAHGNLFTLDNNSDSGDRARLVYVVEGADSGWRIGYQYGSAFSDRGPWNAEKIWHLANADQPAYILPPLAHITSGPSGLCFNYGATALPERYRDHFFVCDFRGEPGRSQIYSFAVRPKGASFEPVDGHEFLGGVLATDCDFAPDGAFYLSDWVDGWNQTGKGRIYRFSDPVAAKNPVLAQTKQLLAQGFDNRSPEELATLLGHPDQRVRREAQFALAARGPSAEPVFSGIVTNKSDRLSRLHALWGLGQLGRRNPIPAPALRHALKDPDSEIRAQAARTLGWGLNIPVEDLYIILEDSEPRVRLHAALALGGSNVVLEPSRICRFLEENADRDSYLRHAGARALSRCGIRALTDLRTHRSASVRLAAVVALRSHGDQGLQGAAAYLDDSDPRVTLEVARFLHDERVPGDATPLAQRLGTTNPALGFQIRALNAHYRLGKLENARAVSDYATRREAPESLRLEAVRMLGTWANPPRRDRVTGLTQNLGTRDGSPAAEAFQQVMGGLFSGPNTVRREAARVAAALGIKEVGPTLFTLAADAKRPASMRVDMLRALAALKDARLGEATAQALKDSDPLLRAEGLRLLASSRSDQAWPTLRTALARGSIAEKQAALSSLGGLSHPEIDGVLSEQMDRMRAKTLEPQLHLEVLEAVGQRTALKEKLTRFEADRAKELPTARWSESLAGGDAEAGRRLFESRADLSCVRCHKVRGQGGDVGPELTTIGMQKARDYLLESLVDPNRQIAQGFETLVLSLTNGTTVSGILKGEDKKEVRLMTAEGTLLTVPLARIEERSRGKSAMPEDAVKMLTKRELRDLVEFLAGLK